MALSSARSAPPNLIKHICVCPRNTSHTEAHRGPGERGESLTGSEAGRVASSRMCAPGPSPSPGLASLGTSGPLCGWNVPWTWGLVRSRPSRPPSCGAPSGLLPSLAPRTWDPVVAAGAPGKQPRVLEPDLGSRPRACPWVNAAGQDAAAQAQLSGDVPRAMHRGRTGCRGCG